MRKRNKSTSMVFIVTLLTALVLLGSTALILLNNLMKYHPAEPVLPAENNYRPEEFIPTAEHSQTVLFILDAGKNPNEKLFLLTRFIPAEKLLWLVPIPGETYSQVNTKKSTVYEFYRTGGVLSAVSAVESALNLPVERYAKLDKQSFRELCDMFGGAVFNVPYGMEYRNENTGELTALKEGVQTLDGNMLRQLLTFPELKGGEEFRIKLTASAVSSMINRGIPSGGDLEYYFNSFVNSAETNITARDFEFRREAFGYAMTASDPAVFKIPVGEYDSENRFVIDRIFRENLAETFGVEEIVK